MGWSHPIWGGAALYGLGVGLGAVGVGFVCRMWALCNVGIKGAAGRAALCAVREQGVQMGWGAIWGLWGVCNLSSGFGVCS